MFDRRTFLKALGLGFLAPTFLAKLAPAPRGFDRATRFDIVWPDDAGAADGLTILDCDDVRRMTGGIEEHVWVSEGAEWPDGPWFPWYGEKFIFVDLSVEGAPVRVDPTPPFCMDRITAIPMRFVRQRHLATGTIHLEQ